MSQSSSGEDAAPKREPTDLYLIEDFETDASGKFFAIMLMLYNFALAGWFFLTPQTEIGRIVLALMWIGGNQALAFMARLGRSRVFRVWKNWDRK